MLLKRLTLLLSCLLLALGGAGSAAAKTYALGSASGGQYQIGGGLPLPIQTVMTTMTASPPGDATYTGTVFPPLLIPLAPGATLSGTTTETMQQKLVIPQGVLRKDAASTVLGVFGQNNSLYAVGTNLNFSWPAAQATLSTGVRLASAAKTFTVTTATSSNKVRYSNPLAAPFGGPAQFALSSGASGGLIPGSAVTIYLVNPLGAPGNSPPCTHTALTTGMGGPFPPGPNPNPACVAVLGAALPTGNAAAGGPFSNTVTTPGGTMTQMDGTMTTVVGPVPGVFIGKFGPGALKPNRPRGTVSVAAQTPASNPGFTNMASSTGFPFTTGMITLSAPLAAGAPEKWFLTGMDDRTAGGSGTLQLVSGSVSRRTGSGPNANRGWVRLDIGGTVVPAMTDWGLAALAGMLATVALVMRLRRRRETLAGA